MKNNILCPFDGFKISVYNDQEYIDYLTSNEAKYNLTERKYNGNYLEYQKGVYRGLIIKIHTTKLGKTVTISGSFHKFYNEGAHNANQYYWDQFIKTYQEISMLLNIPHDARLVNLEVGINIPIHEYVSLTTTEILQSIIFAHKQTKGNKKSKQKYPGGGISIHYENENICQKVYDKGAQYPNVSANSQILRVEKKYKKNRACGKVGYYFFNDLLIQDKMQRVTKELLSVFKKLIIYDDMIEKSTRLTKVEIDFLLKIKSPDFFEIFKGSSKEFAKIKKQYNKILFHHSQRNIGQILIDFVCKSFSLC